MNKITIAKNIIIYSIAFLLLYYVFTLFQIPKALLYVFHLFFPVLIALFFHFLLEPVVEYFTSERLNRKVVVIHLYVSALLFFIIGCYFLAPYVFQQCLKFYNEYCNGKFHLNPIFSTIIDFLQQYNVLDYLMNMLNGWTQSLFYWVSNIVLAMGISFYLSYDNLHLIEKLITYFPFQKQGLCMQTLKRLKLTTYQFMKSLVVDFLFFFALSLIIFYFIDSRIFVWIALFLALTNLIPYIGPYIGGIPVVIYEYIQNPTLGYASFLVIVILQYIESSYIQPYLFSKCVKHHPIALFLALTFFGDLFGLVGMIFSPLFLAYTTFLLELMRDLKVFHKVKQIMNS
ncbi:MAG: AI-2E family transporter [Erysipelotrichales bacterium]|nr:AI-2E family transporter [Erysipelotrichales bacterium]